MHMHKLRMKKRALQFRFTDQESKTPASQENTENEKKFATRNPFKYVVEILSVIFVTVILILDSLRLDVRKKKPLSLEISMPKQTTILQQTVHYSDYWIFRNSRKMMPVILRISPLLMLSPRLIVLLVLKPYVWIRYGWCVCCGSRVMIYYMTSGCREIRFTEKRWNIRWLDVKNES